jgi:cell division protein FtsI (penicillin-binding protein 3)
MTDQPIHPQAPDPESAPAGRAQGRPIGSEVLRNWRPAQQSRPLAISRNRVVFAACCFALLFAAVGLKATDATIISPSLPRMPPPAARVQVADTAVSRAEIIDRNGEVLAVSVRGLALYARPNLLENPARLAQQLNQILPHLSRAHLLERLTLDSSWVYLDRFITEEQQTRINTLGQIGLGFEVAERRQYPRGRDAAHVLGAVGADGQARGGVEQWFDERLQASRAPLRLSIDIRVQRELREAVEAQRALHNALGGAAVMMDIRNGEIIGMVSNPDFIASDLTSASATSMFNRVTTGVYEPGSTFKLFTTAMALELGVTSVTGGYDATRPIQLPQGRSISDDHAQSRWLTVPEIVAFSSNIATAHMAMAVGRQRHREFLERIGMLDRQSMELPGVARPLWPRGRSWQDVSTMTIGFGHGIAVTPMQVVTGIAALTNGGILYNPTLIAVGDGESRDGTRVVSERTSETMRRLMRLVVTHGTGSRADAPGYFVGGKTGTAQKLDSRGQYMRGRNVTSFVGAFPMNAPRYALYVMLDEPHARAETGGHATAGLIAAPVFRRIVERVGPMLGMTPEMDRAAAIQASMFLPFGGRPSRVSIPNSAPIAPTATAPATTRPTQPTGPRANTAPSPAAQGFSPTPAPIRRTDATVGGPRVQLVTHGSANSPTPGDANLAPR